MAGFLTANEILTTTEVAKYLKTSEEWVRDQCRVENIPAFKIGKEWRIKKEDLLEWVGDQGLESD